MPTYNNIIEQSIPGFKGLTSSASGIINELLSGTPSTATARNSAASFGVRSGMPGSGLSNAFGYDLYNRESEQRKQRGIDDLLKLVTGYSGTIAPTAGQQMEEARSIRDLAQRDKESNSATSLAQQKLNAEKDMALKKMNSSWIGQGPLAKVPTGSENSWFKNNSNGWTF
jgi:hypothetical protein